MKSIGIIGFGSFGRFLAEKLDAHAEVRVFSYSNKQNKWTSSLGAVAACDYVLPAIPLDAYEKTLKDIKKKLGEKTVVVDVCSVKEEPVAIIKKILPNTKLVATHPLFGPESATETLVGHVVVFCPELSDTKELQVVKQFASSVGLTTIEMTAAEHDQEMAVVQGLTFFIARALKELKLHDQKLSTPSFQKLLALANLEKHHSDELFETIQANPRTKQVRERFVSLAKKLNQSL